MSDDLKIRMPEWARNMYNRLVALINAGGGGGGEARINSISLNGVNVPPDANKNVALQESDPTVPSWAKQSSKPTYTAQEVGAISTTQKGAAGGVAELDSSGKVPSSQLPAAVALTTTTTIPIPASGNSASYNMTGLTSDYELLRWNFSASAENAPPADLSWDTYNGYFTITNSGGTTSESMRPVFALPKAVAITSH